MFYDFRLLTNALALKMRIGKDEWTSHTKKPRNSTGVLAQFFKNKDGKIWTEMDRNGHDETGVGRNGHMHIYCEGPDGEGVR